MQRIRYRIAEMYKDHLKALETRAAVMHEVFETEVAPLVKYY